MVDRSDERDYSGIDFNKLPLIKADQLPESVQTDIANLMTYYRMVNGGNNGLSVKPVTVFRRFADTEIDGLPTDLLVRISNPASASIVTQSSADVAYFDAHQRDRLRP